ncbi:MAG: hypothetical protein H5T85_06745 [Actinobacteria bacterium]|nr:hypothetical protein [Actinomycetota bacterium]
MEEGLGFGSEVYLKIVLKNVLGQRYIGDGLRQRVRIEVEGVPGNDLGAFMDGALIEVFGNAQDGVGNTMNSGKIIVHGDAGDIVGHSMRGGEIYIKGDIGYRGGIHMKSYLEKVPVIVIGGSAGDFLGEYMAGGIIIVLGIGNKKPSTVWFGPTSNSIVGYHVGTGMHGGRIYIRGSKDTVEDYRLGKEARKVDLDEEDRKILSLYIGNFCKYFGMAEKDIVPSCHKFVKLVPSTYRPYGKLYAY